mmetsp:Transcript_32236/g.50266  ORF Transcript_32236/g.50266 Transcript_32236/m.50266 type:complete len:260 (+) Transcript_32236:425-1204(+)
MTGLQEELIEAEAALERLEPSPLKTSKPLTASANTQGQEPTSSPKPQEALRVESSTNTLEVLRTETSTNTFVPARDSATNTVTIKASTQTPRRIRVMFDQINNCYVTVTPDPEVLGGPGREVLHVSRGSAPNANPLPYSPVQPISAPKPLVSSDYRLQEDQRSSVVCESPENLLPAQTPDPKPETTQGFTPQQGPLSSIEEESNLQTLSPEGTLNPKIVYRRQIIASSSPPHPETNRYAYVPQGMATLDFEDTSSAPKP